METLVCQLEEAASTQPQYEALRRPKATLPEMVMAAWRLSLAVGVLVLQIAIQRRAQMPTWWPVCPICGKRLRSKGFADRRVLTLLGWVLWKRPVGRCPDRCEIGHVVAPLDEELGIGPGEHTSAEVKHTACAMAVFLPFELTARFLAQLTGVHVGHSAVWEWVQEAGRRAMKRLDRELKALAQGATPQPEALSPMLAGLPLVCGADGVMVPFRSQVGTPEGKVTWREVKVGIFARLGHRLTQKGKQVVQLHRRRLLAVLGKPKDLQVRLRLEGLRQGMSNARLVSSVSDGSRWLWPIVSPVFAGVRRLRRVLDFYHAAQNIWKGVEPYFGRKKDKALAYFRLARHLLRQGEADVVLADILRAAQEPGLPAGAKKSLERLYRYLKRYRGCIDYGNTKAMGLPIGSGMVESACKWLIQQRFKCVGMRWSEEGFNHLLHLRLAWVNGRFDDLFFRPGCVPLPQ